MKQIPCKECISLAICYHQNLIKCEDLYDFMCHIDPTKPIMRQFMSYRKGNVGDAIYEIYDRYVTKTNLFQHSITLTSTRDWRIEGIYEQY